MNSLIVADDYPRLLSAKKIRICSYIEYIMQLSILSFAPPRVSSSSEMDRLRLRIQYDYWLFCKPYSTLFSLAFQGSLTCL